MFHTNASLLAVNLVVFVVGLTCAAQAQNQATLADGIVGDDNREIVDSWDHPWSAIGKIFTPKFSTVDACTGTLVAPRVVATAAHCLFNFVTQQPVNPSDIHFVAGYRREKYLGHSIGECVSFNSKYDFSKKLALTSVEADYAFVVLQKKLPVKPVPIHTKPHLKKSDTLIHAGYGRDRRFILSAHHGCHAKYRHKNAYLTDCDTKKGASGGPVLIKNGGEYFVAGVMSGAGIYNTPSGQKPYNSIAGIMRDRQNLSELAKCK